ncbi:MAG: hypothetical protein AAFU85_19785, partial [Planctomycetota bacterium]
LWYPASDTSNWVNLQICDLPVSLPLEQFTGKDWHLDFLSDNRLPLLSVTLSRELFDKPRPINVKLDAPNPHIRPLFSLRRDVRYTAGISQRMRYRNLPRWDQTRKTLAVPVPPSIKIWRLRDGSSVYDGKMTEGCMGLRWFAVIDQSMALHDGDLYRMKVEYDSGGLFPKIVTSRDFRYDRTRHGP